MSNAIIRCRICAGAFDKGTPAQSGQDDVLFVCEDCGRTGYPQNGWVNPKAIEPIPAAKKPSLLKRLLGKG